MSDVLNPPASLLAKIGSIAAHLDEAVSADGHPFDMEAAKALLAAEDVQAWLKGMEKIALIPLRRKPSP